MSIKKARQEIWSALEKEPDFRETYVANIAMLLLDRCGITDSAARNRAGNDIVDLIFQPQAKAAAAE